MSSIPKLRVARHSPSLTGTGSTTIPIEHDNDLGHDEHEQERATLATLSSETEQEPQLPAHRLRTLMARIDSHPTLQDDPRPTSLDRKARSAPSVRDSDLDSIRDFPFEPANSTSAKASLRDVFEKALVRPVGNSPSKSSRRHETRASVSDDDLSARPMSRAESFDRLKAELDTSMLRSALDHTPLSDKPLSDNSLFDQTLHSLHSADFQDMSTPPRNGVNQVHGVPPRVHGSYPYSDSEQSPPVTPKLSHSVPSSSRLPTPLTRTNRALEPFENFGDSEDSPHKPRHQSPVFPSTRPKLTTSTFSRPSQASTSHNTEQVTHRARADSPDNLHSKSPSPWSSSRAQHKPLADTRSLHRTQSQSAAEDHIAHPNSSELAKEKTRSGLHSIPHDVHRARSKESSHPDSTKKGKQKEEEHEQQAHHHLTPEHKAHHTSLRQKSSPSPDFHSALVHGSHLEHSQSEEEEGEEEEEKERLHERQRNWNSPRPRWSSHHHHSHAHPRVNGTTHSESESGTERDSSAQDQPNGIASAPSITHEVEQPPNQTLLKTPRVPGSWATPPAGGIFISPESLSTPGQTTTSLVYNMATPEPPGGYTGTPPAGGVQNSGPLKGILKVRWQQNQDQTLEATPSVDDLNVEVEIPAQPSEEKADNTPSIAVTPSTPSPRRKSQLRVVDAMGVELSRNASSPIKASSPTSILPVSPSTTLKMPQTSNSALITRIKDGLTDLKGDLPATPDQSSTSIIMDTTLNTEDERERLRNELVESRESRAKIGRKLEILQGDEVGLEEKLAKLRRSFLESEVIPTPLVVNKQASPWRIAHLMRRMFVIEIVCSLLIYCLFNYRSRAHFASIYYDPLYPALQAHPQGKLLAAHAAGYDDTLWTFSGIVSVEFWQNMPINIWNYIGHTFWSWWTEGGWYGWTGIARNDRYWVPT